MISDDFHIFDIAHLITLVVLTGFCSFLAWGTGGMKDSGRKWVGRSIGLLLIGYAVFFYVHQGMAQALSWEYSLPLEFCSLVQIACILALFGSNRLMHEITYFWGMGGILQALVTPDLGRGFPSWDFILFFWSHGAILLGIVFIIAAQGFRPRRNSVARMMIALNLYAIAVGTINYIMDWNYGYLCRKPAVPSLLDFLGPWPWYLLSLEVISLLAFSLLALPWKKRN